MTERRSSSRYRKSFGDGYPKILIGLAATIVLPPIWAVRWLYRQARGRTA